MNDTSLVARESAELKLSTNFVRPSRNALSSFDWARSGCAAINQEGQGVGTEPICELDQCKKST